MLSLGGISLKKSMNYVSRDVGYEIAISTLISAFKVVRLLCYKNLKGKKALNLILIFCLFPNIISHFPASSYILKNFYLTF